MVGRRVHAAGDGAARAAGDLLFCTWTVSPSGGAGKDRLRSVSFSVRGGEIVGVAGVEGNGQLELEEVIAGWRPRCGRVRIAGATWPARSRAPSAAWAGPHPVGSTAARAGGASCRGAQRGSGPALGAALRPPRPAAETGAVPDW